MRATARRWRRALAAAATATLLAAGALVGLSVAVAQADSGDKTEEISPEKYPPPPEREKTVTPKTPVSQPTLARTGVSVPPAAFAATGIGLLVIGGGLLVLHRRLSKE